MRKIKAMAFILSLLSCLCLFGVGYSTWYNINPLKPQQQTGSIVSYDVLEISNTEMTTFKFSMLSFKTGDAQSTNFQNSDTGTITVTYTVSADTVAATGRNFRVDTALGYDADTVRGGYTELFGELSIGEGENKVSVTCEGNGSGGETITLVENTIEGKNEIKSAYKFENVPQGDYSFTITYTFNIPSADGNFANKFGKYLHGAETANIQVTKFIASAYVSKIS